MEILQAGVPKSGNYWLYKIIFNILEYGGIPPKSFIQNQPIHSVAKTWQLSFDGQSDMDFISIENQHCYYRISAVFKEKITDIDDYINQCNQVWTHSQINPFALTILPKFAKIIYIIRDPRDVAISYSKFAFTTHKLKNHSAHYETDPHAYLNHRLDEMTRSWVQHVGGYLEHQKDLNIHVVFYEQLLNNFQTEIAKILDYLEITLTDDIIETIKYNVSFDAMKAQSPNHLRKGTFYQWKETLNQEQKQLVPKIAGSMLELLNYPINDNEDFLPNLSTSLDTKDLQIAVNQSYRTFTDQCHRIYFFLKTPKAREAKLKLMRDKLIAKINLKREIT